ALVYYVLARTGRESWMLYVTAVFAGAYGLLYFRELAIYLDELLLADGLGLVSVLVAWRPGRKLSIGWLLAPAAWSLFFAGLLFHYAPKNLGLSLVYFISLLGASLVLFSAATLLARKQGFGGAW